MKTRALLVAALALVQPLPVLAQDHSDHGEVTPPVPADEPAPPEPEGMEGMDHSGHDMDAMEGMEEDAGVAGTVPAPPVPEDHAADALFDPSAMARSRAALRKEMNGGTTSMVLLDLAEYRIRDGRDGYRWEGEAWFGGDRDRLLVKSEGEGDFGEAIDDVELQALYSRAIDPYWNIHAGLRHDPVPNPSRTYAVVGIEGIAPYWFHVGGQLFLSDKSDLRARIEASYDERITQRLILQPRVEINLSAQDMPAIGVGAGLEEFELGLRLRYEFIREFAPYVGVEWTTRTGETARLARLAGERPSRVNLVVGLRFWF